MDLTFWFIIYKPAVHLRERLTLKSETGNHPGSVCLQGGQQAVAARCKLAQCRHSFLKSAKLFVSHAKPLLLLLDVDALRTWNFFTDKPTDQRSLQCCDA